MKGVERINRKLLRSLSLPHPDPEGDKEQRGRVLVVGGAAELPGAAILAGVAALRAGAGKLQIATRASLVPALGAVVPEARVVGLPESDAGGIAADAAETVIEYANRADAVLLGTGMMDRDSTAALVERVIPRLERPALLLDAEALADLPAHAEALQRLDGRVVLTPHAGEMAGMLDLERAEVEDDPLGTARRAAELLGATVALKGAASYIAAPDGTAYRYQGGGVGLATSGSGDVLAGVIAGLLARGATATDAAVWGVYLHGEAGNRLSQRVGPIGFLARELPAEVPGILGGIE